jgi:signal peptidase II
MSYRARSFITPPAQEQTLAPDARIRWDLIVAGIALVVILLDQFTKHLIVSYFSGPRSEDVVHLIGNVLTFQNVGNRGAAFSSFTHSPGTLAILILAAVGVIAWLYFSTRPRRNPWLKVTFGLIMGGAAGNLIDRVRLGYVVDFVHFQLPSIHFDFAVFNLADSCIVVGVLALAVIFWTLPRDREPAAAPNLAQHDPALTGDSPMETGMHESLSPPLPAMRPVTRPVTRTPVNSVRRKR